MSLGFGSPDIKAERRQLKSVEDVTKILSEEITSCTAYENALLVEIREIEDLKHNFKITLEQMGHIRTLAQHREQIIESIVREYAKRNTDIDTAAMKTWFTMITKLDEEFDPMLNKVVRALQGLLISETHALYKESDKVRSAMDEIDKNARELSVELQRIVSRYGSVNLDLKEIVRKTQALENERSARPAAKGPMGFTQ